MAHNTTLKTVWEQTTRWMLHTEVLAGPECNKKYLRISDAAKKYCRQWTLNAAHRGKWILTEHCKCKIPKKRQGILQTIEAVHCTSKMPNKERKLHIVWWPSCCTNCTQKMCHVQLCIVHCAMVSCVVVHCALCSSHPLCELFFARQPSKVLQLLCPFGAHCTLHIAHCTLHTALATRACVSALKWCTHILHNKIC